MERVRRAYSTRSELFQTRSTEVKMRCYKFMENLLLEVENRLPSSTAVFRGLSGLSLSKILSQAARLPFDELPSQNLMGDSKDEIQNQYRKIILNIWRDEPIFGGELPKDSATFWSKILKFHRSDGIYPFKALATYALAALSTPVSNAVVERTFSHVTWVKSKYRKRMSIALLDAVIRVRLTLRFRNQCCRELKVTEEMLDLFNSVMYNVEKSSDNVIMLDQRLKNPK